MRSKGIAPEACFKNRDALSKAKIHGPLAAGISGDINEVADSIVLLCGVG